MKRLVILGAGTAGTMMANHLHHKLNRKEWTIDVVDERTEHHYQPGYLFLPFDIYKPEDIIKSIKDFIPSDVNLITKKIDRIVAADATRGQGLWWLRLCGAVHSGDNAHEQRPPRLDRDPCGRSLR